MDEILFAVDGSVATITLNRPAKLNAMTPAMIDALMAHVATINATPDIWVVVLRSAGEKAFCAGSDIKELDRYPTAWEFRHRTDYTAAVRAIDRPVICAINGYCFGGGLELAMSCDIRICSPNAQFAAPEIKLGWIGGGGMTHFLVHAAGSSNAAMMILTGDPIDAERAREWGILTEIVPLDRLHARAEEIARVIASRAPLAAQTAKNNLRAAFTMTRPDAIRYEWDLQAITYATEDAAEGRLAFKEKRPPRFCGR